jgi:hypothetical protein
MRSGWKDVFKFLSGASFVTSGASLYFYWLHAAVPFPFFGWTRVSPEFLGVRGIIQFVLFVIFFYLGFVRK